MTRVARFGRLTSTWRRYALEGTRFSTTGCSPGTASTTSTYAFTSCAESSTSSRQPILLDAAASDLARAPQWLCSLRAHRGRQATHSRRSRDRHLQRGQAPQLPHRGVLVTTATCLDPVPPW